MSPRLLSFAALAALLAAPAAAQPPSEAARAQVLQAVIDCRAQTDSAARLACFDAAVGRLEQAETAGEVVVVDRDQVRQARREVFGFSVPSFDLFGRRTERTPEDRVDQIDTTLRSVSTGADGYPVFRLENGQTWRQTAPGQRRARPGDRVEIRRGAIGSYFLRVNGLPGVRAQRVQ